MKLVAVAALIAVCGAAKLDRTYLPPASAKSAGGSPGALQTPFAGNSFNNGLGGLPKGSYENEFQGVVVNAAAAGTRAAEEGVSGLGAPRISYGSTDSRVGAAAFKTNPSAFRPETNNGQAAGSSHQGNFDGNVNQGFSGGLSGPERPRAALDRAANILRYENEITPEGYQYGFETDNGISAEEAGVATNGVQAQGGFSYTADDGQVFSVSYTADENGYQPKGDHLPTPPPIPEEILKSLEQNAREEAAGLVDDGSYNAEKYNTGSDYSENGDTNGKFTHQSSDFGKPVADAAASGTFVTQNNQPFRKPSSQSAFEYQEPSLASQNEQTSTGSGGQGHSPNGAINGKIEGVGQFNQYSASKPGLSQKFGHSAFASQGQTNAFGSSPSVPVNEGFESETVQGQIGQSRPSFNGFPAQGSGVSEDSSNSFPSSKFSQSAPNGVQQSNRFGSFSSAQSVSSSQGLGNRNEYLPPANRPNQNGRPHSGRPQNYRPQIGKSQPSISSSAVSAEVINNKDESSTDLLPLSQQDLQSESRPQSAVTSFGQPLTSNGISSQNGLGVNNQKKPANGRRPSINGNSFTQGQSSLLSRPNEYLPPNNRRPLNTPQVSTEGTPTSSFGSQSSFASSIGQSNGFNRPQTQRPSQNGNRVPTSQSQTQFGSSAQSNLGLDSQKATVEPDRQLTTPLETSNSELSQSEAQPTSSGFISSSKPNGRPTKPSLASQFNQNRFGSQSNRNPSSRPDQTEVSAFPTQPSFGQFNQNSQFQNQQQPQNSFGQNNDAQYASSTQRPSYAQQPQGADDSYFYNQPSKAFSTPQSSRFPSAPSDQFDRITQQSQFSQNNQFSSTSGQFAGSTKYPRPPTVAPSSPSSQAQGQFSGQVQGSSKYSRPPTVAPTVPSAHIQFQGNALNGVTQASASPFPSQTPTQATQGQFGLRPSFQQSSQFSQTSQTGSSFNQQPTRPSFGQFSQTSQTGSSFSQHPTRPSFGQSTAPQKPSTTFQSQSQAFTQQSLTQEQPDNVESEQPVSSQQYNGEIYEYNKPAQSLPPPDSTPASSSFGSFGQKVQGQGQFASQSRPQLSQTNDQDDQRPTSQFGGSRPQFSLSSQFGQNAQSLGGNDETEEDSKPYGALAQSQNAAAAQGSNQQLGSKPQLGASSFRPQSQKPSSFGAQSQTSQKLEEKKPQFGLASAQSTEEQSLSSHGSQNQFGFTSACCKDGNRPQKQGFGGQFSQSFTGAQNRPQPTSSFAGMGEQFGGPRQPPSFDAETGYHY